MDWVDILICERLSSDGWSKMFKDLFWKLIWVLEFRVIR